MFNWKWENLGFFGDKVNRSNLLTTSSGLVQRSAKRFSCYGSDYLRVWFQRPRCRQYKPGNQLRERLLNWHEKIIEDDDDGYRTDPAAPSVAMSCLGKAMAIATARVRTTSRVVRIAHGNCREQQMG